MKSLLFTSSISHFLGIRTTEACEPPSIFIRNTQTYKFAPPLIFSLTATEYLYPYYLKKAIVIRKNFSDLQYSRVPLVGSRPVLQPHTTTSPTITPRAQHEAISCAPRCLMIGEDLPSRQIHFLLMLRGVLDLKTVGCLGVPRG